MNKRAHAEYVRDEKRRRRLWKRLMQCGAKIPFKRMRNRKVAHMMVFRWKHRKRDDG